MTPATGRAVTSVLGAVLVASVLAACTGSAKPARTSTVVTGTRTVVTTRTVAAPTRGPDPATSVAPLPADGRAPAGEVKRSCPYIKAGLDAEPTDGPNVADLEGDRVGTVTVLTGLNPVGCRFYFAYSYGNTDHEAVADILPATFATAADAHNAMIATASAGGTAGLQTERNYAPGVDGIRYRTRFFGPDGPQDWAFVFAKGRRMVVVHTQQTNASFNAFALARAITSKF